MKWLKKIFTYNYDLGVILVLLFFAFIGAILSFVISHYFLNISIPTRILFIGGGSILGTTLGLIIGINSVYLGWWDE